VGVTFSSKQQHPQHLEEWRKCKQQIYHHLTKLPDHLTGYYLFLLSWFGGLMLAGGMTAAYYTMRRRKLLPSATTDKKKDSTLRPL
jgi:hypothetical protein